MHILSDPTAKKLKSPNLGLFFAIDLVYYETVDATAKNSHTTKACCQYNDANGLHKYTRLWPPAFDNYF
ncbi:hypothetical protein TI03_00710 [Achromatium sp. WMS1]|nr:hypothetical protein TI03_00710 [Achromatium sp. WMS1]